LGTVTFDALVFIRKIRKILPFVRRSALTLRAQQWTIIRDVLGHSELANDYDGNGRRARSSRVRKPKGLGGANLRCTDLIAVIRQPARAF